jgi:TolB-like protein/DNA-binding winged helix-turn-helix (wHTH) protein
MPEVDNSVHPQKPEDLLHDPLMNGFWFGEFKVLPRQRQIIPPDGEPVLREDKHIMVLVALAQRPGEVIARADLLDAVWDRGGSDEGLNGAISHLRNAFGDTTTPRQFIYTVNNGGYGLLKPVRLIEPEPVVLPATDLDSERPQTGSQPDRRWWKAVATVLGIVAITIGALNYQVSPAPPTVAVIPFTAPENEALPMGGEGLADYLISALTDSGQVNVVARQSSFAIPGRTMDVGTIGDELGADYLVGGAIRISGDTVTLTLTLTDTASGTDVWIKIIEGRIDDLSSLHADALSTLSLGLENNLSIQPLQESPARNIEDEAYQKYLQARYQWSLRGEARINRAIVLLREAIGLRPDFAEAHLALAQSLAIQPFYTDPRDLTQLDFSQARAALSLASMEESLTAEVNALEGYMFMEELRWAEAHQSLNLALVENPDYPLAHYWYSQLLSIFGDYNEALNHIETAVKLDPMSAFGNDRLTWAYLWVNDDTRAAQQYDVAVGLGFLESRQPKTAILLALRQQQWEQVRSLLSRLGLQSTWVNAFVRGLQEPEYRDEATQIIQTAKENGAIPREFWFGIWVLFQDADRAFRDFDYADTQDVELLWAAESEFLRQDARFEELLEEIGLTEFVKYNDD